MAFVDRLLRRRTPLSDIVGFGGGNLQDQLDEENQGVSPDRMSGVRSSQVPPQTMADSYMNQAQPVSSQPTNESRPREVNPFQQRLMRPRISDPTSFDVEHLRELQSKPLTLRDKAGLVAQNIATNLGGHPLQTRRQREEGDVAGRIGQDLELEKVGTQRAIAQSQIGAREAAQRAAEERLQQGQANLDQRAKKDHENNLIRTYNSQTDFNPDDPSNAAFVAEWQKTFGYKPSKNVRGSQLAVVQGYNADGSPMVSIINKGNQTATQATGALPAQTEGQVNRTQRQRIVNQQEAEKNARQQQGIAAANQRQQVGIGATNARMGDPEQMYGKASEMWDEAQRKREEAKGLGRREAAVKIREAEQLENQTRQLQRQGDRAKAAQGQSQRSSAGVGKFNLGAWKADHPDATDADIQAQRSKAKARNLSIIE